MVDQRRIGAWILLAGAAIVVVATVLPWVRSGSAWRTSFEAVRSADHLGRIDSPAERALATGWVFVPLLGGFVALGLALRRMVPTAAVAVALAALGAIGAVVVLRGTLAVGPGPYVSLGGSLLLLGGSAFTLLNAKRSP